MGSSITIILERVCIHYALLQGFIKIVIATKLEFENTTLLDSCIQSDIFTNISDIYIYIYIYNI